MIALDTNLLVRLLVLDDPRQVAQVKELLRESAETGEPCFISDPVSRASSARNCSSSRIAKSARKPWRRISGGKPNSPDYLIGAKGRQQGARSTYTFDRGLRGQEGFTLLE